MLSPRYDWDDKKFNRDYNRKLDCGGCEYCDREYIAEDPDDAYWDKVDYPRWALLIHWAKQDRKFEE